MERHGEIARQLCDAQANTMQWFASKTFSRLGLASPVFICIVPPSR